MPPVMWTEVTSMEVDEREEGEMEAIDNAVLERRGDIEVVTLEREHRAALEFEVAHDVDVTAFILPN